MESRLIVLVQSPLRTGDELCELLDHQPGRIGLRKAAIIYKIYYTVKGMYLKRMHLSKSCYIDFIDTVGYLNGYTKICCFLNSHHKSLFNEKF